MMSRQIEEVLELTYGECYLGKSVHSLFSRDNDRSWSVRWQDDAPDLSSFAATMFNVGTAFLVGDLIVVINADYTPDGYIIRIKQALEMGDVQGAAILADRAIREHPLNASIIEFERILGTPKVVDISKSTSGSWDNNRSWLEYNWDEFRGAWVALRNGELLSSGKSLKEVKSSVQANEDVMFVKVN